MNTLHTAVRGPWVRTEPHRTLRWLSKLIDTLQCWVARMRSRDALGELDEHMLKDVGLTRADIVMERAKHFWER